MSVCCYYFITGQGMNQVKDGRKYSIQHYSQQNLSLTNDVVCAESPLELIIPFKGEKETIEYRTLLITMRTPGHDYELARGFLFSEGIISSSDEIISYAYSDDKGSAGYRNSLKVNLRTPLSINDHHFHQSFKRYSSCGVCGKTAIQDLELLDPPTLTMEAKTLDADSLNHFSEQMLKKQRLFQQTGAAHASGLFSATGELLSLHEDIGRHNALDKLIGQCLLDNADALKNAILLISGRVSFEMVQKTIMAGIPILVAAGAPSSLAIDTAKRFNLTLIGFLRSNGYNIYNAGWRLKFPN